MKYCLFISVYAKKHFLENLEYHKYIYTGPKSLKRKSPLLSFTLLKKNHLNVCLKDKHGISFTLKSQVEFLFF